MKICKICNVNKDLKEFQVIKRRGKECIDTKCKLCFKEYYKQLNKKSYTKNIDKRLESQKEYTQTNKEKIAIQRKEHRDNNKEKLRLAQQVKYNKNKETYIKKAKQYYIDNKEHLIKKKNERYNVRMKTDPLFKLKKNISCLIKSSIRNKGFIPNTTTVNILGCSLIDFKSYLETQFKPWMNWDNRGLYNGTLNHGWDIDHIKPLSTAKTLEDIIRLNHYMNLQPLCSHTNRDIKKNNY